jgi:dienelactone hydrolase
VGCHKSTRAGAPLLTGLLLLILAAAPHAWAQAEPDCTGPAGDPEPGTPAWESRERDNVYCATQRNADTAANPAYLEALAQPAYLDRNALMDPFREPTLWNGSRYRFEEVGFTDEAGKAFPGFLFRPPADQPPPYPGVVIMHGGAANQEMYLWASEGLAEAGYMVLSFNIGRDDRSHYEDTGTALDFLTSAHNPHAAELDRTRIGLAGHSAGGVAVSRLGQEDPRVSAIVSWDRAQSGPMPEDLQLRTPALFVVADFNCQRVPVCLPESRSSPPDPRGPGNKDEDFQRLAAAGVDTMKIALRAATHLDFTEFPQANGSRHGVATTFYYTLAWFDRYLRGAQLRRLVATSLEHTADAHNISGGRLDPATGGNLPARIAGQAVADRLSFHFRSAYFLAGGRYRCESMRAGCAPPMTRCPTGRKLRFKLRKPRRQRVVAVRAYVNGKRIVRRRGRRLRAVVLSPLPGRGTFRVRIVARTNRGVRVITRRAYRDCRRGRTVVRFKRARARARRG